MSTATERPDRPTADRPREGNRRDGNGQRDALAALLDQYFDAWGQAVETWRQMAQSSLDMLGPVYSVLEEATRATQAAGRAIPGGSR